MTDDQLAIDQLHACPACGGAGQTTSHETGGRQLCRVCEGTGTVPYDPDDTSIPF